MRRAECGLFVHRILEGSDDGCVGEVCTVHERASGGVGAGVPRVPEAELHPARPADQGEPYLGEHRAEADQSVVSESTVGVVIWEARWSGGVGMWMGAVVSVECNVCALVGDWHCRSADVCELG